MQLVGNVKDKDCIIIDDLIDTAGTLCQAGDLLKKNGAKKVYAFASHGVFSNPAGERIHKSSLEKVVTTNSISQSEEFKK